MCVSLNASRNSSLRLLLLFIVLPGLLAASAAVVETTDRTPGATIERPLGSIAKTPDLEVTGAAVRYLESLDLLVFEQTVRGRAGGTVPTARGGMDGAPVLGHVFPTTLAPEDVGFGDAEGIVALAVTSHPDFDDTPLWDENLNRRYDDDGVVFHPHWVVLVEDERVAGGLAVRQIADGVDLGSVLPPTHPGMPMYMDSPGFSVVLSGDTLKVLVPAARVGGRKDFRFDAVTAYMEVNPSGDGPMLGVYQVYAVLSGDLGLPYRVESAR